MTTNHPNTAREARNGALAAMQTLQAVESMAEESSFK